MAEPEQLELAPAAASSSPEANGGAARRLDVLVDRRHGAVRLEWREPTSGQLVARVTVKPGPALIFFRQARWMVEAGDNVSETLSSAHPTGVRAKLKRFREFWPVADDAIVARVLPETPDRAAEDVALPARVSPWTWLGREIVAVLEEAERRLELRAAQPPRPDDPEEVVDRRRCREFLATVNPAYARTRLHLRLNYRDQCIELFWSRTNEPDCFAKEIVRCTGRNELTWTRQSGGAESSTRTRADANAIDTRLEALREEFPVEAADIIPMLVFRGPEEQREELLEATAIPRGESPWDWLAGHIEIMAQECSIQSLPRETQPHPDFYELPRRNPFDHELRRLEKEERQQRENAERLQRRREEIEQERLRKELARKKREQERAARPSAPAAPVPVPVAPVAKPRAPLPPIQVAVAPFELSLQETMLPLASLRGYFLREKAAQWWVSNQTDNLLCLPFCRIEQLEYQLRTALRVLGPLRGRALLSDEVGLGKTIEAGLVLKELLTRGMAKRFLVLTVPSLVDQWQEELAEKFALETVTTNGPEFRAVAEEFWRESRAIVASLHTLKQPTHLAVAQSLEWDVLIVDEAHYLRNRASQAWQAVNALPRQFLLLLTATPVQNSLEELYNLVTLLQPGQLPSPKEFRARFIDPEKPHQPREPDELRRLLGQVMIRNTRANAGITLPPRRAETVSFEPDDAERAFWSEWETELRAELALLPAGQSALWGRLLLQTAGSSPAAWREVLASFPQRDARDRWLERAPLETSWTKKCELLQPLTRGEGGVVVFTQFLHTQMALAQQLRALKAPVFVINGQTPAEARHPIAEEFRKYGGALLLTHSGTEGRNLQFCHRLVNFDLPWNPMEIEQRIGRLHRLGQQRPVRIYNFVQAGTLQEHLLHILQEKLNLFELVVGETGLILGDRFTSDEFADEVLRRWRESEGRVAEAMQSLGDELASARQGYEQIKQLDETLFAKDFESL